MKYTFIPILVLHSLGILAENDSIRNVRDFVSIDMGYSYVRYLDPIESAQIYTGGSPNAMLSQYTIRKKSIDEFTISYSKYKLTEEFNNHYDNTNFTSSNINLTYSFFLLALQKRKISLYVGPKLKNYILVKNLNYDNKYYEDIYINYFGTLNLSLYSNVDFNKASIATGLDLPVVNGFVQKYDKKGPSSFDYKFTFLNILKSFSYNAKFVYKIRRRIYVNIKYQFDYFQYPRYEYLLTGKYGIHSLLFGISINYNSK